MAEITLRIEDIVVEVIDAEIKDVIPRKSRNAHIAEILAERYAQQIEEARRQKARQEKPSAKKAA